MVPFLGDQQTSQITKSPQLILNSEHYPIHNVKKTPRSSSMPRPHSSEETAFGIGMSGGNGRGMEVKSSALLLSRVERR
ncbi:unnamed protein product, partial [Vitis vinifera]